MIIPDMDVLVYAISGRDRRNARARVWLEDLLNGEETVGWVWPVVWGFVQVSTNPRVTVPALSGDVARMVVTGWLARPNSRILDPGPGHMERVFELLSGTGSPGGRVREAQVAALAIEYGAEVHSADGEWAKFEGVRWRNPLEN